MIIPKTAYFYWTGGRLPWIREQALVTFQRHHPGWEVVLGSPEVRAVPRGVRLVFDDVSDPSLPPAARSDVWRWHVLGKHGGFYADTDVLFLRNVEPLFREKCHVWLTIDMGTPIPMFGYQRRNRSPRQVVPRVAISIGVLASLPRSAFFLRALAVAQNTARDQDYQSHGTMLLTKHWQEISKDVNVGGIPAQAFYREGSSAKHVRKLWTESGPMFPSEEYGLHWYGGSVESAPYLTIQSPDDLPDCWVRKALEHGRVVA